ncbi:geranyl transferase [Wolbachia pipientis]|uniref:Geranyl transferase n=2 Tax=Wolbachia pipientis TaxID=955 RepID=A0A1E7QJS6_WOLPI|nr:geranyl transferase [Wolbachia pipientis]
MLNETVRQMIISEIEKFLPKDNQDRLVSAMRYTLFAPAKYIRSFLVIASSSIFGIDIKRVLPVAVAIEFVHTYSLIHDDLPCMDNSDSRRGQQSCHKKFDEATAVLVGDALLTLAFEILSSLNNGKCCEIIRILSQAIGHNGMVKGQVLDIESKDRSKNTDFYQMQNINLLKTAKLFAVSCEIGAVVGSATDEQRKALCDYGITLGRIFQIKDDIKDCKQDNTDALDKLKVKHYIEALFDEASHNLSIFLDGADQLYGILNWLKNND